MSDRFHEAAKDLSKDGRQGWGFPVPHYLAGHAIELALKAHLVHRGADERSLKSLGHDLEAAMRASNANLIAILTPEEEAAIRWINPYYEGKELEYTAFGAAGRMISVPDVSLLNSATEKLLRHLRATFPASTSPPDP